MNKMENVMSLADDELDRVTGGTTGTNSNDYTNYCDACGGGGKTMSRKENNTVQLICKNCRKIYETCPVCKASWRPTRSSETGGEFRCAGGHIFIAYWE